MKLVFHDYTEVHELSDEELKKLITDLIDIEEVPSAIRELYEREPELSIELAKNIVMNNIGDEYLQAGVIEFIFDYDKEYIINYIESRIVTIDFYVYGCILNCFSVESMQSFGKNISSRLLKALSSKYNDYNAAQKEKIKDKYEWFLDSYKLCK